MHGPTELRQVKNFTVALTPFSTPVIDARVIVNAGSADEAADQWGTAHFLEHMFFKGTTKRDYKAINKVTSRLGHVNAHTSTHGTAYEIQFLLGDIAEAIEVLMEMVFLPSMPEEEAKKETGVIVEECQMYLDDPHAFFWNNTEQHILGDQHGHSVIGTIESIQATTVEKMRQFRTTHYTPGNMLISVVGNIDFDELAAILEQHLPDLPDGERSQRWEPTFDWDDHDFTHKAKQAIVALVAKGATLEECIANKWAVDVFRNALGGGAHSLLFDRLREELGLCYHVGASHWSKGNLGLFVVLTMLDEDNIQLAVDEINKIIAKVRQEGFTDEILEISKTNRLFTVARAMQTSTAINYAVEDYFHLDNTSLTEYLSFADRRTAIELLTNDDMIEVARTLLGEDEPVKLCQMTQLAPERVYVDPDDK